MYGKVLKIIYRIENNSVISSIRKGFTLLIPALLVGAFALLFRSFPVPAFQTFIEKWAGGVLYQILSFLFDATVGFMSIYLVMSISYYYAAAMKDRDQFLQVMAMVVSAICFAVSFGAAGGSMELSDLGPVGVFSAMFTAVAATRIFYFFCEKMSPAFRFRSAGSEVDYRNSLSSIYPLLLCTLIFVALNLLIKAVFKADNLNDLITNFIVDLFHNVNDGLGAGLLYVLVLDLLWAFGIHGGNALEQVSQTYLVPNDAVSGAVISKSFLDNFALIGGCGTSICLVTALLLFAGSRDNRQLARSAAPAVFFNINEILVYGLPIVLNPVMIIPFILTPLCSLLLAYGAAVSGFLPMVKGTVTWTTPVFFSGYLASGSWRGVAVQVVTVLVGTAIYAPFVKLSEQVRKHQAEMLQNELTEYLKEHQEAGTAVSLLGQRDSMGILARNMAAQLRIDVEEKNLNMGYQPQFNCEGEIIGAEALLRWRYMEEAVYPPLAVALSQEDGFFDRLTECVIETSMKACSALLELGSPVTVSANITAEQLNEPRFVEKVIRMAEVHRVAGHYCLEITEESAADRMEEIPHHISRLKAAGILAAVDDFNMGRTSLKYLQHNSFYAVKLDGSLVRGIVGNKRNQEIVSSIISLGRGLDFVVMAEYVETEEIRSLLQRLGCSLYQGYLYSSAVPLQRLEEMLRKQKGRRDEYDKR